MIQKLKSVSEKVENILGKEENADCQHFLLFPQCFQKASSSKVIKSRKKLRLHGKELTLSQTSPGFYVSAVQIFWKHCGEKDKLLVTSNLSFSHSFRYWFG